MDNLKNQTNEIILIDENQESANNEIDMDIDIGDYIFPETEIKDWEQYFFTENVLINFVESFVYENNIICLCTPAVADAFLKYKKKNVICLDIDERFSYLPGYLKYDITNPVKIDVVPDMIIVDPPFFKMNLVDLFNCVESLTKGNKLTKIVFAFIKREEKALLNIFKSYGLRLTKFNLEYRSVDPTKWCNYGIYTNFEVSKFKFYGKIKKNNNK
jgi:hypothetical protein